MDKKVYRFPIPLPTEASASVGVKMPQDGEILHFGYQPSRNEFSIWARVAWDAPYVLRQFLLCGTGNDVPEEAAYIGSAHMPDGYHIFHLFEVHEEEAELPLHDEYQAYVKRVVAASDTAVPTPYSEWVKK